MLHDVKEGVPQPVWELGNTVSENEVLGPTLNEE